MKIILGSIEEVLDLGEYDQGDEVQVSYDELVDLLMQANLFRALWRRELYVKEVDVSGQSVHPPRLPDFEGEGIAYLERKTNRPLHPCLGGASPYTGYLPL